MTDTREKLAEYEVPFDELPLSERQVSRTAEELAHTRTKVDEFLHVGVRPAEKVIEEQ